MHEASIISALDFVFGDKNTTSIGVRKFLIPYQKYISKFGDGCVKAEWDRQLSDWIWRKSNETNHWEIGVKEKVDLMKFLFSAMSRRSVAENYLNSPKEHLEELEKHYNDTFTEDEYSQMMNDEEFSEYEDELYEYEESEKGSDNSGGVGMVE